MTTFQWRNCLTLAEALSKSAAVSYDEAYPRCVVSRAYYGAFTPCREKLLSEGYKPGYRSSHKSYWDQYLNNTDPTLNFIGRAGIEIMRLRNRADYERPYPGDLAMDAEATILAARSILWVLPATPHYKS